MPPSFRGTPPGGLVGQHNETTSDRSDLCSSHGAVPQTHLGRCLKSPWKARHSMSCHGVQRDAACKTWTEEGSQRERSSHLHSVPSTRVGIFFFFRNVHEAHWFLCRHDVVCEKGHVTAGPRPVPHCVEQLFRKYDEGDGMVR